MRKKRMTNGLFSNSFFFFGFFVGLTIPAACVFPGPRPPCRSGQCAVFQIPPSPVRRSSASSVSPSFLRAVFCEFDRRPENRPTLFAFFRAQHPGSTSGPPQPRSDSFPLPLDGNGSASFFRIVQFIKNRLRLFEMRRAADLSSIAAAPAPPAFRAPGPECETGAAPQRPFLRHRAKPQPVFPICRGSA